MPGQFEISFYKLENMLTLKSTFSNINPVSYTHLDVYKRQPYGCDRNYDNNVKLGTFQMMCGTVNRMAAIEIMIIMLS